MSPLDAWHAALAASLGPARALPRFDPRDGGASARLLLVLETPGPTVSPEGAVSRDNPGGTARNLRRFLDGAGIARGETLLWNVVPWIVRPARPLRAAELREGASLMPGLVDVLPSLFVVVLAGRHAASAFPVLAADRPGLKLLAMPHPSPTYVNTSPDVPARIGARLDEAAALLRTSIFADRSSTSPTACPTPPSRTRPAGRNS